MRNLIQIIFCLLLLFAQKIFAQNENNIWYFGDGCGVDFNSGSPVVLSNGAISQWEGCATICDYAGNLLFYTNGITVWNKQHSVMMNGDSLAGDQSSTQSALILKQPGQESLYYIFTVGVPFQTPNTGLFCYSIADLSMNSGNGKIIVKNQVLDSASTEKLTATLHNNGRDYWVMMHNTGANSVYKAFLFSSSGVSAPVISNVGYAITSGLGSIGYIRFSPDGSKLADARISISKILLSDFDIATGVVSNTFPVNLHPSAHVPYGVDFSFSGRFLYCSYEDCDTIYQWDLSSNSGAAINSTQYLVMGKPTTPNCGLGALQRGPDNKMYIVRRSNNYLSVINDPEFAGAACNFQDSVIALTGTCHIGLPNCVYGAQNPTGIKNIMGSRSDIFPNPSSGILHIRSENKIEKIIVSSLFGEMLQKPYSENLDLSSLPKGIYFLTTEFFNGEHTVSSIILN